MAENRQCRVTVPPERKVIVDVGTHEIGTGIRTQPPGTADHRHQLGGPAAVWCRRNWQEAPQDLSAWLLKWSVATPNYADG
jgi:hypothetical protein